MFEEVTDVFARQRAKNRAAFARVPRKLKIDDCRLAITRQQEIRLFGEVVVDDPQAMHATQDPRCFLKIFDIFGPALLHGNAIYIGSVQRGLVRAYEGRDTVETFQCGERTRLPRQQTPGEPANRQWRIPRVPSYQWAGL